jgi:hypothetical protein
MSPVRHSVIYYQVYQCDFYAIFLRQDVSSPKQFNHASFSFLAVPLDSLYKSGAIGSLMAVRLILDNIRGMVSCSCCESLVKIKWAEGLLLKQKGFGFLPSTFTLDRLVIDIWLQLNIDLIDEGIELLFDEANVILRILPGEVDILQDLLSS